MNIAHIESRPAKKENINYEIFLDVDAPKRLISQLIGGLKMITDEMEMHEVDHLREKEEKDNNTSTLFLPGEKGREQNGNSKENNALKNEKITKQSKAVNHPLTLRFDTHTQTLFYPFSDC